MTPDNQSNESAPFRKTCHSAFRQAEEHPDIGKKTAPIIGGRSGEKINRLLKQILDA
jgi:hypothetical protein